MADWITQALEQFGYLGVFLLMLAENLFPPIPSEIVMPLAGYAAVQGERSLIGVILAGSLGSLAGAAFWFWVGRQFGVVRLQALAARFGRWLTLSPRDIEYATRWFERHGPVAVLLGRLVPAVRTLISVPAGVLGMRWGRFLAYTSVGTVAWTALLGWLGYVLAAQYEQVGEWIDPVSNGVLVLLVGFYLYRVATFDPGPRPA